MKSILCLLFTVLLLLTACAGGGQLALYEDLIDDNNLQGSDDPLNFQVTYLDNGAELTVVLKAENALILAGQLEYSESNFNVGFESLSDWLCKYNTLNHKVACASTTPAAPGEIFKFVVTAKEGTSPGNYPLDFNVLDFNGQPSSAELNTFLNVR